jgi:hypothetical protein
MPTASSALPRFAHPVVLGRLCHVVLIYLSQDPKDLIVRETPLINTHLARQKRPLS